MSLQRYHQEEIAVKKAREDVESMKTQQSRKLIRKTREETGKNEQQFFVFHTFIANVAQIFNEMQ